MNRSAQHRDPTPPDWSAGLALALLQSLSPEALDSLAAQTEQAANDVDNASSSDLLQRLQRQSVDDGELRARLMRAWRQSNPDVVTASQFVSIDGPPDQCEALLRQFRAEDVLLELITGERQGGLDLARWVVANVGSQPIRRDFEAMLTKWSASAAGEAPGGENRSVRVVVFGGHVRDENKMSQRLFAGSPFDVRWRPFEKGVGIANVKVISEAMAAADAVLVVTSMVSHNVMQIVKRLARSQDIPFDVVPKATDAQLKAVLSKLFPDLNGANW